MEYLQCKTAYQTVIFVDVGFLSVYYWAFRLQKCWQGFKKLQDDGQLNVIIILLVQYLQVLILIFDKCGSKLQKIYKT